MPGRVEGQLSGHAVGVTAAPSQSDPQGSSHPCGTDSLIIPVTRSQTVTKSQQGGGGSPNGICPGGALRGRTNSWLWSSQGLGDTGSPSAQAGHRTPATPWMGGRGDPSSTALVSSSVSWAVCPCPVCLYNGTCTCTG